MLYIQRRKKDTMQETEATTKIDKSRYQQKL